MKQTNNIDKVWDKVWKEYYNRAVEVIEEHDTEQAHKIAILCQNIEDSILRLIEYTDNPKNLIN